MATFNSNLVNAGQQTPSVMPNTMKGVYGTVAIPANTTPTLNDVIALFSMPGPSSHIIGGWIDFPILDSTSTLRLKLFDGTNNIIPVAANATWSAALRIVLEANGQAALGLIGQSIAYTANTPISLVVTTTGGATVGASIVTINFGFFIAMD